MSQQLAILKDYFQDFNGVDYRTIDAADEGAEFAREVLNAEPLTNGSPFLRRGSKGRAPSAGGGGMKSYVRQASGTRTEESICIGSNLHREKTGTVTITYSGAGTSAVATLLPTLTSGVYSFVFTLTVDDVVAYTLDLGTGIEEAAPVTVATLVAGIDALPDFACVGVGTQTGPAAFLPNTAESVGAGLVISFRYWEQIYSPTSNPFSTFAATFTSSEFELAALFNHANRFWIATGVNELYKYDGVQVFRAGMPRGTTFAGSVVAGGAIPIGTDTTRRYMITYEQIDALGWDVEGDNSNLVELTFSGGNQTGRMVMPTIQPTTGFLTSYAYAANAGTETDTTIDVDDGAGGAHTLQVGQTAFFRDNAGAIQEKLITARTNSTITFVGAVTIANNAVISANLRINLWREKGGGSEFYLVREFANDPSVASITYDDGNDDTALSILYDPPVVGHGLPPANLKYLTAYQNNLIGANAGDNIYFSDPDGPEYWNVNLTLRTKSNEAVRSVAANRDILLVQKYNESIVIQGDLPDANYRQESLIDAIGTDSYHSVLNIEETLWFYSRTHGVRRVVSSGQTGDVSYRVLPAFTAKAPTSDTTIIHKRVVAVNFERLQLALFFFPTETTQGGTSLPNENSFVLAADYRQQFDEYIEYDQEGRVKARFPRIRWWKWMGLNFGGGADIYGDDLIWQQRGYNEPATAMEYPLMSRLENGDEFDFTDNAQPIEFEYDGSWYCPNGREQLKKWIKAVIYSYAERGAESFAITCELQVGWINDIPNSQKVLDFGVAAGSGAGYGYGPWGDFPWGDSGTQRALFTFHPIISSAAKLRFSRTAWCERPGISGWAIQYVPAYMPKITKGAE